MAKVNIDIKNVRLGDADGRGLEGDLYLPPASPGARPAVLLIFGGSWRENDPSQQKGYGLALAKAGFVCLATDYRYSSEAIWPAQLEDVTTALQWLRDHATELDVDPNRIGVSGHSSGGHLALMVGATAPAQVCAVAAFYPPTRLFGLDDENDDHTVAALMGPTASEADYQQASPITYASQEFPPAMLISGDADRRVPIEHTHDLHAALKAAGNVVELHVFADEEHAFDVGPELGRVTAGLLVSFFQRFLVRRLK